LSGAEISEYNKRENKKIQYGIYSAMTKKGKRVIGSNNTNRASEWSPGSRRIRRTNNINNLPKPPPKNEKKGDDLRSMIVESHSQSRPLPTL